MINLRKMKSEDWAVYKKWLYSPHVARWYHHPSDWLNEAKNQDGEFHWLHHFIVEYQEKPIGFCQYYACKDSDESWEGYTAMGGSYSIDYLIGETAYLRKGIGKQIVSELKNKISLHNDAKRIVVQPEAENKASCGLLRACGFQLDEKNGIYILTL